MSLPDRWVLTATLTTLAPLTIRTGAEETDDHRPVGEQAFPGLPLKGPETNPEIAAINAIELDRFGHPFIPGSALKGLIRSLAATHLANDDAQLERVEALLGGMVKENRPGAGPGVSLGRGGSAEFRNAFIAALPRHAPPVRGRTAIDRGSRTAADGMLRHDRAVAPGTAFAIEIVVDRADVETIKLLRGLLALIDGKRPISSLGSGDGRVALTDVVVRHWDADAIKAWLLGDEPVWRNAQTAASPADTEPEAMTPQRSVAVFRIALHIAGHFLVSVAVHKTQKVKKDDPSHIPIKPAPCGPPRPELPASSFDGAARAQAERIFRTVHGNPDVDWSSEPPEPLEELFGSRRCKGLFTPSDFVGAPVEPTKVDFNAIDRLSGGGLDGAKFAVKAFEAPVLRGDLNLCFERVVSPLLTGQPSTGTAREISAAAVGLLALTLRDLADGDITLGYGTRKGFGDVAHLEYGEGGGLHDLLDAIGTAWIGGGAAAEAGREAINGAVRAFREWEPAA